MFISCPTIGLSRRFRVPTQLAHHSARRLEPRARAAKAASAGWVRIQKAMGVRGPAFSRADRGRRRAHEDSNDAIGAWASRPPGGAGDPSMLLIFISLGLQR